MSHSTFNILLVEDDSVDIMAFRRMLKTQKLDYNYTITDKIAEAKRLLSSEVFDIVVADYKVVDGIFFDLFDTFITLDIPFICVTGAGDEEIAVKALKAGAYDYIIKDQERNYLKILPLTIRKAITRKKSEEQIKLLESVVVHSSDGIIICEIKKGALFITYTNQAFCEMSGFKSKELLLTPALSLVKENLATEDRALIEDAINNSANLKIELLVNKKDKTTFWGSLSLVILKKARAGKNQYVLMVRDATERKKAEKALLKAKKEAEQAQEAEKQFLANISHEFRTHMNSIIGMANFLSETAISAQQNSYLAELKHSSNGLMQLINDILDLSKIEANKIEFREQPFNLFDLLIAIQKSFIYKLRESDIETIIDVDLEIANDLIGDAIRLNQILTNLLENALRFTEKGEIGIKVTLKSLEKGFYNLEFQVFDTGIGMTEEELVIVFNHFKEANQRIYRKFGGTGVGLSIVKKLVELQGGNIHAESKKGKGTIFTVNLAFKDSGVASSLIDTDINIDLLANEKRFRELRFLVAEDNPMNQKIISEVLRKWGSEFDLAENGKETLHLFEQKNYDVILMDINMPIMDGYEATQNIRNHPWASNKNIPIIALSAAVLQNDIQKIFDVGMNEYITKPIDTQALKRIILQLTTSSESNKTAEIPTPPKVEKVNPKVKKAPPVAHFVPKINNDTLPNQMVLNLDYLKEFSGGDAGFIREMMSMYLEQIPDEAALLLDYSIAKSWDKLGKLAHKIKPNFLMMGLNQQESMAKQIEKLCKSTTIDEEKIAALAENLADDAFNSIQLIEVALAKLG